LWWGGAARSWLETLHWRLSPLRGRRSPRQARPALTLRAFVTRKASLALFLSASQEPLLTLKVISSNLGFPLTLQAFVIQNSPPDCFVTRRVTIPHPRNQVLRRRAFTGAAFFWLMLNKYSNLWAVIIGTGKAE
jgi:hypothetical protein